MRLILSLILSVGISSSFAANKVPPFSGPDFTGVYECKGLDAHEGEYKGKVTLKLKKEHSKEEITGGAEIYDRVNNKEPKTHNINKEPKNKTNNTSEALSTHSEELLKALPMLVKDGYMYHWDEGDHHILTIHKKIKPKKYYWIPSVHNKLLKCDNSLLIKFKQIISKFSQREILIKIINVT